MKHLSIFVLALFVLASCSDKTFKAEDSPIDVKVGQEFTLKVPSSPSTGYKWHEVETIDSNLLDLKLVDYEIVDAKQDGGPGFELWKFKALKAGQTNVVLHYWKPWEEDSATDTLNFEITIN